MKDFKLPKTGRESDVIAAIKARKNGYHVEYVDGGADIYYYSSLVKMLRGYVTQRAVDEALTHLFREGIK